MSTDAKQHHLRVIWGGILMLTAVCFNGGGLLANRFFLGMAEASMAPGLSIMISMWYKRSEQPLRQGAWFLGNTCGGLFGGLVSYGLGHITSIPPGRYASILRQKGEKKKGEEEENKNARIHTNSASRPFFSSSEASPPPFQS